MSLETRSSSALFKRAEQLKRWEESETNREVTVSKSKTRKIQFSAGCVFLAACAAGDKNEVLRLIEKEGADIDTANVDGLTALHQACIDDDLDMVEFLVEHGADVNRGDNEGWTPLHATASCGFVSIARYLIEHGGNVAAVNNDAELPVDIADTDEMEDMLQKIITSQGIDAVEARNEEERLMLADAKEWLNGGERRDLPHPKTGAGALHVACAKGYIKVMSILLQGKENVNVQDFDGWTPLHAAAHWGQREACEILVENFCDMEMKNFVGQTAFDVADTEMVRTLEELKKKQAVLQQDRGDVNAILPKSGTNTQKRRSSITRISNADKSNLINKDASAERQLRDRTISEESSNKVKKVELEIKAESDKDDASREEDSEVEEGDPTTESSESTDDSETSSDSDTDSDTHNNDDTINDEEKKNRVNRDEPSRIPAVPTEVNKTVPYPAPTSPPKTPSESDEGALPSWRRPGSVRIRGPQDEPPNKLRIGEKDNSTATSTTVTTTTTATTTTTMPKTNVTDSNEVALRRTHSFESDEKFYRKYRELQERIKAGSCPTLHPYPTSALPTRSTSLREKQLSRRGIKEEPKEELAASVTTPVLTTTTATPTVSVTMSPSKLTATSPTATSPLPTSQVRSPGKDTEPSASAPQTPSTPTTPGGSKLSPGNIFKNFFKSFVPPVRDEESETQRKAHAKRVRETRRSTQGVTLEEIKSAEQLVKKKNQQQLTQATQQLNNNDQPAVTVPTTNTASITATITTAAPTAIVSADVATKASDQVIPSQERRPSWRLRVDNGDRSKFLLEDARNRNSSAAADTTTAYVRRTPATNSRPSSAPVESSAVDASVTLALRRNTRLPDDDKEQDKENDSRTAQATQAVIQRRRRPKRRSTGVVHVDMDEIDPDRQDVLARGDSEDVTKLNNDESGGDWSARSSRLNSVSSTGCDSAPNSRGATPAHTKETTENGELDYKKLYEESLVVNDRLRETLKKTEKDLTEAKSQLAKPSTETTKSSLSELEKRERRAMERKLSEMEEELKQLQKLKAENERLKAENRALTRVVSKLTNSANATK